MNVFLVLRLDGLGEGFVESLIPSLKLAHPRNDFAASLGALLVSFDVGHWNSDPCGIE
jgi:hypothetical protein